MLTEGWTWFYVGGVLPVASFRPNPDLARSAAARSILEALWVPAALLPLNGVIWEEIDDEQANAIFRVGGESMALEIRIASDGRPLSFVIQRWTDSNPEKVYRWQPTGGFVEEMGTFEGYTVPTRMSAGNQFGTPEYFSFF